MKLSITETATVLGKSERQVRYMIRKGELAAKKEGKRWRIASDDLPLDDRQKERLHARLASAREALEEALEPAAKAVGARGKRGEAYSVSRLAAFEAGAEIYRELAAGQAADTPARDCLQNALLHVARGCHSFHAESKARAFDEARQLAATAVAHLLLPGDGDGLRLAERLEEELIPKLAGLVAANEKRGKRRSRFARFGGARKQA